MGWYKRSKLAFDAIHSFVSKIGPRNSIRNHHNPPSKSEISRLALSSPIYRNLGFQFCPKQTPHNQFIVGARRYYYVDRNRVQHFRPRGPRNWFQNPRTVLIVVLVGSGTFITVYFGNLETVPYTKRKHFVLLSKRLEKQIGESQFEQMKGTFKGKILPAIHPESIRVRLISKDIIEALQRGLRQDQVWSDPGYAAESGGTEESGGHETLMALRESGEGNWHREDEILDDKWVQESRKKGQERGSKSDTGHLEGLNWEVLVVNEPVVNAFCLPGGKIVVFTGLLEHFRTDAEIATIIGHEVGHAVARHAAEGITKNLWFTIVQLILYQFVMPDLVHTMSNLFLRLPFSRRMEMEADYIGLLLIASAGYDPRVAPKVYEKLGKVTGDSALRDYLSTHPSGKKRAQLLAQAKVMEEALTIYRDVQSGRGIEGFL
ncbi:Mitochondrial metalloendopeptidase [Actinidia chinensis var. chinensis]|uniref:Mitochondrial metalloendopeptidase n=1 Tax=Actinidia chinensis var. chinensis TaxID=1590841 RepID=A0A2R6RT31_ACTCC|nr:Mitochondrial metalloendopeptidase [Actinidia chinensis var. chinensis]